MNGACAPSRGLRDSLQQLDILGPLTELVVADQGGEGRSAEDAEFLFVDLLEQRALVELRGALQVPQQFPLADVQNLDLQLVVGLALIQQYLKPRQLPSSFWKVGWCRISLSWMESK